MLKTLLSMLELNLESDEVGAVTYDFEVVTLPESDKVITQFDFFTIHTTFGEAMEVHREHHCFPKLYKLFLSDLPAENNQKSNTVLLYKHPSYPNSVE